jgi:FtsH-binding integral membrane protein
MSPVSALFSFGGTTSRAGYIGIACVGVLVKQLVDLSVASAFSRPWDLTHYLMPVGVPVVLGRLTLTDMRFLTVMLAVSVPFAWVGPAITTKRFRTIGWPLWLVVLFFVPIANIASFALAAAWPEHEVVAQPNRAVSLARIVPDDAFGAAVFAVVVAGILGVALVPLGTVVLGSYGWGLFAAIPFVQGAIAAYAYAARGSRALGDSVLVAIFSIALTAVALLALALEGAVCILMAVPVAAAFAAIGAVFGHSIGRQPLRPNTAVILVCVLLAPTVMGAEAASPRVAPTYMVTTSIDIAAPPDVVWRNVISFPDLPLPTELPFRAGIAYPVRAKIVGRGVGAVRYCEFSTGDFVEPITAWEPDHKLAFNVRSSAEPMREWSPYGHIDTPHLHNYMVSRHGQFVLEALPNGGTRLIGTTWYQHHLWPAAYWRLWSDAIVHDIHYRVLKHIKALSERQST